MSTWLREVAAPTLNVLKPCSASCNLASSLEPYHKANGCCTSKTTVLPIGSEVMFWDLDGVFRLETDTFRTCLLAGTDGKTHICYLLDGASESTDGLLSETQAKELLDTAAAGDAASDVEIISADSEGEDEGGDVLSALTALTDDAQVTVEQELLAALEQEVAGDVRASKQKRLKADAHGWYRCPACPFRAFPRMERVGEHLQKYHTPKNHFVCSGTKQLRILLSIHDTDMILQRPRGRYLRRSADLLRKSVQPALARSKNSVDKNVRLLLRADGPALVNASSVKAMGLARRVGKIWYTQDFAEKIFREMLLHHAKAGETARLLGVVMGAT